MAHDHGHGHGEGHGHGHGAGDGHGASRHDFGSSEVTTCPVMPRSTVVKAEAEEDGLFRDDNGTRYYFCCDS